MTSDIAVLIVRVVRGEAPWQSLRDSGVTISVTADSVSVIASEASSVEATACDVAQGWLRYSHDALALAAWSRFILSASVLFDLRFREEDDDEQALLESLWDVTFGEAPTREMDTVARRILLRCGDVRV